MTDNIIKINDCVKVYYSHANGTGIDYYTVISNIDTSIHAYSLNNHAKEDNRKFVVDTLCSSKQPITYVKKIDVPDEFKDSIVKMMLSDERDAQLYAEELIKQYDKELIKT